MPGERPVDPDTIAFLQAAGCVYAEDEARILTAAARSNEALRALLERRAAGEPLEYVVGWAEFCGLRVRVCRGVFVPRRRSEFLAECAIDILGVMASASERRYARSRVLDLCCGSGAIGLAVSTRAPCVELLAADDSPAAVDCARENLAAVHATVYQGDLFEALPGSETHRLDVVVSSPPYVPTAELDWLPAEARLYEPWSTLDGGPDGTDVQRQILELSSGWLRPGGFVIVETGADMAERTAEIGRQSGFTVQIRHDPERDASVIVATR